jgi:hypothetical protein
MIQNKMIQRIKSRLYRTWHVFRQWPIMYRMRIENGTVVVRESHTLIDSSVFLNFPVDKRQQRKAIKLAKKANKKKWAQFDLELAQETAMIKIAGEGTNS